MPKKRSKKKVGRAKTSRKKKSTKTRRTTNRKKRGGDTECKDQTPWHPTTLKKKKTSCQVLCSFSGKPRQCKNPSVAEYRVAQLVFEMVGCCRICQMHRNMVNQKLSEKANVLKRQGKYLLFEGVPVAFNAALGYFAPNYAESASTQRMAETGDPMYYVPMDTGQFYEHAGETTELAIGTPARNIGREVASWSWNPLKWVGIMGGSPNLEKNIKDIYY